MKLLLDTHVILWYFEGSPALPQSIESLIDDPANQVCICAVSLWEIAIKAGLGKLRLQLPLEELLENIRKMDFTLLQIENEHLLRLQSLPFLHRDPFDRLILSSAIAENMTIITKDDAIQSYDVPWLW